MYFYTCKIILRSDFDYRILFRYTSTNILIILNASDEPWNFAAARCGRLAATDTDRTVAFFLSQNILESFLKFLSFEMF